MTVEIPVLGSDLQFEDGVYPSKLSSELTLTNAKAQMCIVMPYPTGADLGISFSFVIPQNYDSAPVLVLRGILNGTPANVMAFGVTQLGRDDSEAVDTAYEAQDLASNSTWTGYANEDQYEETITLTPASAYQPGDVVYCRLYRDDSVDTTTFDFLLQHVAFQYTEA